MLWQHFVVLLPTLFPAICLGVDVGGWTSRPTVSITHNLGKEVEQNTLTFPHVQVYPFVHRLWCLTLGQKEKLRSVTMSD